MTDGCQSFFYFLAVIQIARKEYEQNQRVILGTCCGMVIFIGTLLQLLVLDQFSYPVVEAGIENYVAMLSLVISSLFLSYHVREEWNDRSAKDVNRGVVAPLLGDNDKT